MNVNREDVIISALSSLLLENIVECEDFNSVERFGVKKQMSFCVVRLNVHLKQWMK